MNKETLLASMLSKPLEDDSEEIKLLASIESTFEHSIKGSNPIYSEILVNLIENRFPFILQNDSHNYIYFLHVVQTARILTRHPANQSKLFNKKYLRLYEQILDKFIRISDGSNSIVSILIEIFAVLKRYFENESKTVDDITYEIFVDFIANSTIVDNIINTFRLDSDILFKVIKYTIKPIMSRDIVIIKLCKVNSMKEIIKQLSHSNIDIVDFFLDIIIMILDSSSDMTFCNVFIPLGGFVKILELSKQINEIERSNEGVPKKINGIISKIANRSEMKIQTLLNENIIKLISNVFISTISKPNYSLYKTLSSLLTKLIKYDLLYLLCSQFGEPLFNLLITLSINLQSHKYSKEETTSIEYCQIRIIRLLRIIVIIEKHRKFFKSVFPTNFFSLFLQVGQSHDQDLYLNFLRSLNNLKKEDLKDILQKAEQNKHSVAIYNYLDNNIPNQNVQIIGGYQIIEMIGKGGFGSVYKVYKNGKYYALKTVSLEEKQLKLIMNNKNDIEKAISEVQIWKNLNHPKIIKYIKSFIDQSNVYILMELVNGITLGEYISAFKENNLKISEGNMIAILSQIMSGLKYMHKEAKVVYRDLNPNNIMLDCNLNVKLIDFGLTIPAKTKTKINIVRNSNSVAQSLTAVFEGTIFYSSPEIMNGDKVGSACDIWALGCVIYEMIKYKPPFEGDNPLTVAKNICDKKFVEEIKESDCVNKDIYDIMQSCFEKDDQKRANIDDISKMLGRSLLDINNVLEEEKETLQKENQILRELFQSPE